MKVLKCISRPGQVTSEIGFRPKRTAESFPPHAKALYTELMQIWLSVMVKVTHRFEAAIPFLLTVLGCAVWYLHAND